MVEFGSAEFLELAWTLVKKGRQASVALDGDMLVNVNGEAVLIKAPSRPDSAQLDLKTEKDLSAK